MLVMEVSCFQSHAQCFGIVDLQVHAHVFRLPRHGLVVAGYVTFLFFLALLTRLGTRAVGPLVGILFLLLLAGHVCMCWRHGWPFEE